MFTIFVLSNSDSKCIKTVESQGVKRNRRTRKLRGLISSVFTLRSVSRAPHSLKVSLKSEFSGCSCFPVSRMPPHKTANTMWPLTETPSPNAVPAKACPQNGVTRFWRREEGNEIKRGRRKGNRIDETVRFGRSRWSRPAETGNVHRLNEPNGRKTATSFVFVFSVKSFSRVSVPRRTRAGRGARRGWRGSGLVRWHGDPLHRSRPGFFLSTFQEVAQC